MISSNVYKKNFGRYLKESREKADLSQSYVSEKLGLSSSQFISNIERGIATVPLSTLRKLVRLYSLKTDDVMVVVKREQRREFDATMGSIKKYFSQP